MSRLLAFGTLGFLLCLGASAAWPQDAAEVVKKADLIRAPTGSFIWNVTIVNDEPNKSPSTVGLQVFVKGNDKTFVKFVSPPRDVGRSLLSLGRDLWIFLPDAGKPVRIPLAQRLVGQVANGDIARTNYSGDYGATLVGSEKLDGIDCYVLDLKAKSKEVTYAAIRFWVAKPNFRPMKAEYFAGTGTLLKTGTFEEYKLVGGQVRPTRLVLVDAVRKGMKSTIDFGALEVRELPDKYFDKNYMKNLD